jgi:hypothetical protein
MEFNRHLITLCLVIILFTVLSSYKIESFVNFSQTTVAKDIPKNPNDFSCYKYIKSKMPWKIDAYSERSRRMISAMRTGLRVRKSDLSHNNPYNDSCVIPKETISLVGVDSNCKAGEHQLRPSDADNTTPDGCVVDLRQAYKDENKFKSLLNHMDASFNEKYIRRINELKEEIARLKVTRNTMKQINENLGTSLNQYEFDFKKKCDKALIDELNATFRYRRKRLREKIEEEYIEVDQFLVDKFNNLTYDPNNEYITTRQRYNDELENYNKMQNWRKWYEWWYNWLQQWSTTLDDDLGYYKGIVEEFVKWF